MNRIRDGYKLSENYLSAGIYHCDKIDEKCHNVKCDHFCENGDCKCHEHFELNSDEGICTENEEEPLSLVLVDSGIFYEFDYRNGKRNVFHKDLKDQSIKTGSIDAINSKLRVRKLSFFLEFHFFNFFSKFSYSEFPFF